MRAPVVKSTFKYTVMYVFVGFCAVLLVVLLALNAKARADAQKLLHQSIRSQLMAICYAARESLDAETVAGYSLDPAMLEDPEYIKTLEHLRSLARHAGAKFIYVLKIFDGKPYFVLDTDTDSAVLDPYELSEVHQAAFAGREGAGIMNVVDEYGSFHTGAVPIKRNNQVIAVVSTDIEDRWIREEIAVNRFNVGLMAFTVVLVMAGMGGILWYLTRKVKAMQDKLTLMAHYDPVTGLPNRQFLIDHLDQLSAHKDRTPFALFFTDLDNFKTVNDKAGHDAGDALLRHIGHYLGEAPALVGQGVQVFRPAAGRLNVTARIGGDEFVLLIPGVSTREEAGKVAQMIIDKFHQTVIDEHIQKYKVGLSIGAALFPSQSEDYHVILRYADIAMYHAKRAGKNDYRIYEDEMPEKREK